MNKLLEELVVFIEKDNIFKYQHFVEHATDAIIAVNRNGLVSIWNRAAETLFGYLDDEVLGKDLALFIIPAKNRKEYYDVLFKLIQKKEMPPKMMNRTFETQAIRRDESLFPIELSVFQSDYGNNFEFAGIIRDVSERKQLETELKNYAEILEVAVMGISTLDPDGYYIRANKAYASIIGYTPAEMIGMSWQKTVPTHSLPQAIRAYQTMLERGQSAVDIEGIRKDRSTFYKQVVLVKKTNHKGEFIGHYCFMKDISQHHQKYNMYDIEETVCNISAYRTLI